MIRTIALACGLFVTPLIAFADTYEERVAVAREYTQAVVADMDIQGVVREMWRPLVDQIESSGRKLSEDQIDKIDALYQETFQDRMREILLGQDEIMADIYTLEEITALRDFYMTDVGGSVMKKMPEMIRRQQPLIIQMMQQSMPVVMPRLQQIVEGG